MSTQDWPGDVVVEVSIVNWVKNPTTKPDRVILDGVDVDSISPSLRAGGFSEPERLGPNSGIAFQGMLPGANYIVESRVAEQLQRIKLILHTYA